MAYALVNHGGLGNAVALDAMAEQETMGIRITRQLEVKNLSQAALARLLGVSKMTVSQWCRDVSDPRPENLLSLAEILFDGDVRYLVHGARRAPARGFPAMRRFGSEFQQPEDTDTTAPPRTRRG